MSKNKKYADIPPIHPSENIKDILDVHKISPEDFIKGGKINASEFQAFMQGEARLSEDIAGRLEELIDIPKECWLDLQKNFDEKLASQFNEEEKALLERLDYSFFEKTFDWVQAPVNELELYWSYLRTYIKPNLRSFSQGRAASYRCSDSNNFDQFCADVWVHTAELLAKKIDTKIFEPDKIKTYIDEIRQMTLQKANEFSPRLREIFAECGIAFVVLDPLPKAGVNGAVKWLSEDKVLFAINNYGEFADKFWFTVFHEIKHILQNLKNLRDTTFISVGDGFDIAKPDYKILEEDADNFARKTLIPTDDYIRFVSSGSFDREAIKAFAEKIKIHIGIVIGRLQYDGIIEKNKFDHLRRKYIIVRGDPRQRA